MKCSFCKDTYETGKRPFYQEGDIVACAQCWESLLREHLTPKQVQQRLKQMSNTHRGR